MRIGVMADSHDNIPMIKRACELFNAREVRMVFHAGDYIAPFSLKPLNQILQCDYEGVFGNNDGERVGLERITEGRIHPSPCEFAVGDWKVLVAHELTAPEAAAVGTAYRLVVHGHTHLPEIKHQGDTLFVNPGESGGWLFGRCTVAIAHLDTLEAEIIEL
ncbi:MAG: metallophosphoesterase [Desulfobacterales bacterium]|nr:metallophosphoesterase [Desulfobacterales bacterium]